MSKNPIAYLIDRQTLYWVQSKDSNSAPMSAATRLIQAIYESQPEQARRILRNRIFTNQPISLATRGMVKVSAKRITYDPSIEFKGLTSRNPSFPMINLSDHVEYVFKKLLDEQTHLDRFDFAKNERQIFELLQDLLPSRPSLIPLYQLSRSVAAALVGADGKVLSLQTNSNAKNRTLHAELKVVYSYWLRNQKPLPDNSKLFVTLKPCKMCAALIVQMSAATPGFEVVYQDEDPGPMAKGTELDRKQGLRRT